ncbi:MAG: sulfotransferase [Candidatus Omnitrophica bacterium]|nr:sulfotransferase [Candidatus Omnitrophota bacterium]
MDRPSNFLMVFHGASASSLVEEILSLDDRVYVPSFEPLENYHNHNRDMSRKEKINWLKCLFSLTDKTDDLFSKFNRLHLVNKKIPLQPITNKDILSVGIKMRLQSLYQAKFRKNFSDKLLNRVRLLTRYDWLDNYNDLFTLIKERNVKIIYSYRDNILKQTLSNYRRVYEKKGQFFSDHSQSTINIKLFKTMLSYAEHINILEKRFLFLAKRKQVPILKLNYEDILSDKEKTLANLFAFLKLKLVNGQLKNLIARSSYKKATNDQLSQAINNYSEFYTYFQKTSYARFLK